MHGKLPVLSLSSLAALVAIVSVALADDTSKTTEGVWELKQTKSQVDDSPEVTAINVAPGAGTVLLSNKPGAIVMQSDRYDAWQDRRLYLECSECNFAKTETMGTVPNGHVQDCPACGINDSFGPARPWMRPPGFAHPRDLDEVTSPDDMPETSYATRAKLTMQTPSAESAWQTVNGQVRVLADRQHLLVSNTGPKKDGYSYCTKCGRIEATAEGSPILFAPHPKPFVDDRDPTCPGNGTVRHVVLGTDFVTDIVLFSVQVQRPLSLKPGQYPTDVALRTVAEALAKAACQLLDIEPGELMAEYRPALTAEGREGLQAEIFLYDTLPGGAGFSSQLVGRGEELLNRALILMKTCPEGCDASCYRCLRSFKNKFEHQLLDRHVGAELLEFLISGTIADFDERRVKASTELLFGDLTRQATPGIHYEAGALVRIPSGSVRAPILATRSDGRRYVIALAGPLTGVHPADLSLAPLVGATTDVPALLTANELVVRGNLPAATRELERQLIQ
jgi:hypothetical protein